MTKKEKYTPEVYSSLRAKMVRVPEAIYKASGIKILGVRIKSLLFTTDVAIIRNHNADSVMAVYPFTPQLSIMQGILNAASVPVFTGIGGGLTTGKRAVTLGLQAELMGSFGVVVNAPMQNDVIKQIASDIDIPLIATVVSFNDDFMGKIHAGADILNVSGGKNTVELIKQIRERIGDEFPIIATGGKTEESILETIEAGANAITYSPPTSAELFSGVMKSYRERMRD